MDNLEIYYKKAAQQLRSGEALFGKPKSVIRKNRFHFVLKQNKRYILC